jgi:hypothetical protein
VGEIWAKFNKNERNVSFGAAIVIVGWLVGLLSNYGGFGVGFLSAVGAAAVLAIYYLKYTNSTIHWPAPIETIVLAISGIIAIVSVINLVGRLLVLTLAGSGLIYLIALLAVTAGALLMAFGAWQEYQIAQGHRPPTTSAPPAAPPSAPAAPSAPPPAESAPPSSYGDGNPPA